VEVNDGVFVSSVRTDDFEPDPEVPGTEQHVLYDSGAVSAGFSRVVAQGPPIRWTLPTREFVCVVEGAARIEIENGPTLELGAGDIASIPGGAETTWYVTAPFKEFWVLG
jgi:uncharacterized cupin superfamily protein